MMIRCFFKANPGDELQFRYSSGVTNIITGIFITKVIIHSTIMTTHERPTLLSGASRYSTAQVSSIETVCRNHHVINSKYELKYYKIGNNLKYTSWDYLFNANYKFAKLIFKR
jgi:hypothetical protein